MDKQTEASLRNFRAILQAGLEEANECLDREGSLENTPASRVKDYQRKVINQLEKIVQRSQPVLGQTRLCWVQLAGWYTLEGIEEFFQKTLPWGHTNSVRIILADSTRNLGEAVLPWVQLGNDRRWTLEGVADFLHEKVQLSSSRSIQVTLLESP